MTANGVNMTISHSLTRCVPACIIATSLAGIASAQPAGYTIVALPCPGGDLLETNSNATGLNEQGHVGGVAGEYTWVDGSYVRVLHGVVWDSNGQIIFNASDAPDGGYLIAKGINNNDELVGQGMQSADPNPLSIGVPKTYQNGVGLFNPDPDQPALGWSWAINDSRQVGYTSGSAMRIYDPVDGDREFALPGYPAGYGQEVWELNNAGEACGAARGTDLFWHSYRYDYDTDTVVDLHDDVRFRHTVGYGINESGDIAGWGEQWDFYMHPIVWAADGREIILATGDLSPINLSSKAEHINGHGDLVGTDGSHVGGQAPIGWIAYDALSVGPADVTTQGAADGEPYFGVPDRLVTASDLNYYVNAWGAGDLAIADLTTQGAGPGNTGYGVPDGLSTAADVNYFVNAWVAGPTTPTKLVLRDQLSSSDNAAWTRLHPFEINEAGQICGTGIVDGKTRGFLMTPIDE